MSIDFNRVGLLLHVVTEAVGHGAAFRDIVAEANFELLQMNEVARQDGLKRAQAKAEADAKAAAELQARQDALAAEAEAKLKADAAAAEDAKIKTQAQVIAAGQAKAEANAEVADEHEPDPQSDYVEPDVDATAPTSNGRRL